LLSDDHPHGSETAQDPVEPPVVVVVVVVIVIVGPVGRHQGAAVGHLNSVHLQYMRVFGPDLYGLAAISSPRFWIYSPTTPSISCSAFTGVNNTVAILSPVSLTTVIKPCSGFSSISWHRRLIYHR
jgi:hypothetical protein